MFIVICAFGVWEVYERNFLSILPDLRYVNKDGNMVCERKSAEGRMEVRYRVAIGGHWGGEYGSSYAAYDI
jgi:hypothetical protein